MIGPDEEGTPHLMKNTTSISMCSIDVVMTISLYYILVYNLCGPLGLSKPIVFLHYSSITLQTGIKLSMSEKKDVYSQLKPCSASKYHIQGKTSRKTHYC